MSLPITIVGIDTDPISQPLTRFAINQTLRALDVQGVLFFGAAPLGLGESFVEIQRFPSIDHYSEFVLKCLWPFVKTEFVLIVHWDGFAVNPSLWKPEFMEVDYVGATWNWVQDDMRVGNGGFCLRSRKLIELCSDPQVQRDPAVLFGGVEDVVICRYFRRHLEERGCKFAPVELAEQFSYESGVMNQIPFGFHGPGNFPLFVPEAQLVELAPHLRQKIRPGHVLDEFMRRCLALDYHAAIEAMGG